MSGRHWWSAVVMLATSVTGMAQSESDEGIESMTVLAQKRQTRWIDAPVAVSSLSFTQLDASGIDDVDALANRLPTLDQRQNAGLTTSSLRIRRLGNIGNIPTFEPAVGVFVDGAYRSRSFLGTSHLLAVDRVEVLRGPQSALYGKNVSAGLVSIYTRPPAEALRTRVEFTQGWIDSPGGASSEALVLDVSGPLREGLGGGIAGRFTQRGHTLENVLPGPDGNDERETALRGQLSLSRDALDLRLVASHLRRDDDEGESEVFLAPGAPSTHIAATFRELGLTPGCPDNVPRNRRLCSVATNELELDATDATLIGAYRLPGGGKLSSTTSFDRYHILRIEDDAIQLFAPMLFYRDAEQSRSIQQELRVESAEGSGLTWMAGAFFYRSEYERGDRGRVPMFGANGDLAYSPIWSDILGVPLAVPGQLGLHDSRLRTRYLGLFAQATWPIAGNFVVSGSMRWQEEDKLAVIHNSVTAPGPSLISVVLAPSETLDAQTVNGTRSRRSRTIPWSVTSQYYFDEHATAYFTAARAAKSGGFNTGFGNAPLAEREFADENIRHYELGAKMEMPEHRAYVSAAAFHTEYRNYQDSAFIAAQFSVGNAERVDLRGVELEGAVTLGPFTLDASASWADLVYGENTRGLCFPGRAPDGSRPGTCVLSGKHPIQAPQWETNAALTYEAPRRWGELFAQLGWSWTDTYNTSFSADPRLIQPAHHDVSLRIGTSFGSQDQHQIVLWGKNLFDERVVDFDSLLNLFNDPSYQTYSPLPRSFGISLNLTY